MKDKIDGNFYEDKSALSEGSIWETTICFKPSSSYSTFEEMVLLECDNEDVEFILTALNSKLNASR